MKNNHNLPWAITVIVTIIAVYFGLEFKNIKETSQSISNNPIIDVKTNTKVEATIVKVALFYDGKDGYSISIPSGNRSTCVWNWEGGSGQIPYSQTTYAETATEKHTIQTDGGFYAYKVNCFDDFSNQYVGTFPTN